MTEKPIVRKVKKVGGSLTVVIPKNMGLVDGDYVAVDKLGDGNAIMLTKMQKVFT